LGEQGQRLGDAGDDDDVVRLGAHASGAGQPSGQLSPQRRVAARVAVAQVARGQLVQHGSFGAQPCGAGERGQVRHAR